jgi:hypothetical protein
MSSRPGGRSYDTQSKLRQEPARYARMSLRRKVKEFSAYWPKMRTLWLRPPLRGFTSAAPI